MLRILLVISLHGASAQSAQAGLASQQFGTAATMPAGAGDPGALCGKPGTSSLGAYDRLFGTGGAEAFCHESGATASFCDSSCSSPGTCENRCVPCRELMDKVGCYCRLGRHSAPVVVAECMRVCFHGEQSHFDETWMFQAINGLDPGLTTGTPTEGFVTKGACLAYEWGPTTSFAVAGMMGWLTPMGR